MDPLFEARQLPQSAQEIIDSRYEFSKLLAAAKKEPLPSSQAWYPYDSMASIDHLAPLFRQYFPDFQRALQSGPVIDVGCGDGDIPLFFASLGCDVVAADNPPNNHNWMTGVRALRERLHLPLQIFEVNADSATELPRGSYGLAISLGVLYHLKNPYLALETLAKQARYCILSTRVADVTKSGVPIRDEPLAYLLDHRETNNDPTNQWICSPAGLERLAKRSGWRIIDRLRVGCAEGANPTDLDKERPHVCLHAQPAALRSRHCQIAGWMDRSSGPPMGLDAEALQLRSHLAGCVKTAQIPAPIQRHRRHGRSLAGADVMYDKRRACRHANILRPQ